MKEEILKALTPEGDNSCRKIYKNWKSSFIHNTGLFTLTVPNFIAQRDMDGYSCTYTFYNVFPPEIMTITWNFIKQLSHTLI